MLVICSEDKTLKLFDISELPTKLPKTIQVLESLHTHGILTIGFSSDNFILASAGYDKQVIVY